MFDLFTRTLSQGIQAFLPVVFCLAWFRSVSDRSAVKGIRQGMAASIPLTCLAGYLFQQSLQQAQWEALLAWTAAALGIWFSAIAWRHVPPPGERAVAGRRGGLTCVAFAAGATLIIVRQGMEIAVVLGTAALQLRSLEATRAVGAGVLASLLVAAAWSRIGPRLPPAPFIAATRVFGAIFIGQAALYGFHESAEARLLPWSDLLHAATEPYGPDGVYGRYVSYSLVLLPLAAAGLSTIGSRLTARFRAPSSSGTRRRAAIGMVLAGTACIVLTGVVTRDSGKAASASVATPAAAERTDTAAAVAISTAPHFLFRGVNMDADYGKLGLASLASPDARVRVELGCERVSFSGGRGICLSADRGVLTTYKGVIFDERFAPVRTLSLGGQPSRTRISPDGRVGTITVFVTGQVHGYTSTAFSTKTTLIDMASGDELGELEGFSTWRNGERFKAADFNFWGVTFARDSNLFYATLKSGTSTYLVRGDLGLRKLTVLRDNVECPSLSPDNRLLAFKKRVGGALAPWRFYVLDLATMAERPIAAETRSVDDQIEWLDDLHVLYGVPRSSQSALVDVWVAPVDGSGPARVLLPEASSPIVVR